MVPFTTVWLVVASTVSDGVRRVTTSPRGGAFPGQLAVMVGLVSLLIAPIGFSAAPSAPSPALSDEPAVTLRAQSTAYRQGEEMQLVLLNELSEPVWLSGCAPFELEAFDGDSYQPERLRICTSEGLARELPPGEHALSASLPADLSGHYLRALVVFGKGCFSGQPLSRSRCSSFQTIRSARVRLLSSDVEGKAP